MTLVFGVSRTRLMRVLIGAVGALTAINVVHQISWHYWQQDYRFLGWRFDISGDETVPTWFSSFTLLVCAVLLLVVAQAERGQPHPATRHWQGLALIFLLLSIDETATLHEWSGSLLEDYALGGALFYAWVVFGFGFVALIAMVYARFYFRLPRTLQLQFLLAAVLYVGGALLLEMFNAREEFLNGAETLTYRATTAIEELMEMAGVLVFINALLSHLELRLVSLTVRIGGGPEAADPDRSIDDEATESRPDASGRDEARPGTEVPIRSQPPARRSDPVRSAPELEHARAVQVRHSID